MKAKDEIGEYQDYSQIISHKIRLIEDIKSANSIRDFGGVWGVHGLYLFEGIKSLRCTYGEMIDVNPTDKFLSNMEEIEKTHNCLIKYTRCDFRTPGIYSDLPTVDVSLLYEIILHQDNHVEVMKNVANKTDNVICFAQPVLKEEMFSLPCANVLLQFYEEELKDELRIKNWWEKEPRVDVFTTRYWMWGQTASYINNVFYGLGWDLSHQENYHLSDQWNYSLMRYIPK